MSGIKYYTLKNGESLPVEFAVVENVHGEPEIRAFYDRNDELLAENTKLRELVRDMYEMAYTEYPSAFEAAFADRMRELGVEVDDG